jgi:hypothetical protein
MATLATVARRRKREEASTRALTLTREPHARRTSFAREARRATASDRGERSRAFKRRCTVVNLDSTVLGPRRTSPPDDKLVFIRRSVVPREIGAVCGFSAPGRRRPPRRAPCPPALDELRVPRPVQDWASALPAAKMKPFSGAYCRGLRSTSRWACFHFH